VAGGLISWECKRQDTIALSTVEAEFMAFLKATTQALWMSKYFHEVELPVNRPLTIYANNSRSIANSTTKKNYRHTNHINIQHYFIKEHVKLGNVRFQYIPTTENTANLLTKLLLRDILQKFINYLELNTKPTNASVQGEY